MSTPNRFHILVIVLGLVLFPRNLLAWGPVVHLDLSMQILTGAMAVGPVAYDLIKAHAYDFLYGSLAADLIVGKKHATERHHCHNWAVAQDLLREARLQGSPREAFMLGYINHLGADVVAHNHVVPQMLIIHYKAQGVGHLYWEARADQRVLSLNADLMEVWRALSKLKFPEHNRFVETLLIPTIFPNKLSHGLYRRNLNIQRRSLWRKAFMKIDAASKLTFSSNELILWRRLAAQSAARAVDNPWSKRLTHLDPTGREALACAEANRLLLRRELKRHGQNPKLDAMYIDALAAAKTIDINHFEED